ncbi:MAG: hypothetical protein PBV86_13660 [Delftia lacustris]|uniref:hypothetical protein n=1 Tax=Pseudomonadota TaxID=1224 RepID=UPI0012A7954E|nr:MULTISPECIES: hypothetical protein [Pseudomonadota]MPT00869.1 hypothetical protein [Pseudomonas sp.]QFS65880.1 hypothetical protein GCS91_16905 [Delftia tsuruhatensis]WON87465.1 hypothetical protein OK021_22335 [Delftia sp. UGAL515B_04]
MNIGDALVATKAAYDLAATALAARDDSKVQQAMADLQTKLLDALSMGFAQVQALHSLELETQKMRMELVEARRQREDLEAKFKEKVQYSLFEVVPGAWAYTAVSDMQKAVDSRPNFCASCYSAGKVVPLQHFQAQTHGQDQWFCPGDSAHTLVDQTDYANDGAVVITGRRGF